MVTSHVSRWSCLMSVYGHQWPRLMSVDGHVSCQCQSMVMSHVSRWPCLISVGWEAGGSKHAVQQQHGSPTFAGPLPHSSVRAACSSMWSCANTTMRWECATFVGLLGSSEGYAVALPFSVRDGCRARIDLLWSNSSAKHSNLSLLAYSANSDALGP